MGGSAGARSQYPRATAPLGLLAGGAAVAGFAGTGAGAGGRAIRCPGAAVGLSSTAADAGGLSTGRIAVGAEAATEGRNKGGAPASVSGIVAANEAWAVATCALGASAGPLIPRSASAMAGTAASPATASASNTQSGRRLVEVAPTLVPAVVDGAGSALAGGRFVRSPDRPYDGDKAAGLPAINWPAAEMPAETRNASTRPCPEAYRSSACRAHARGNQSSTEGGSAGRAARKLGSGSAQI